MRKLSLVALPLVALLAFGGTAESTEESDLEAVAEEGASSRGPFRVTLVGVPPGKTAGKTGRDGRRLFVSLSGKSDIYVGVGPRFEILDANGTDGRALMSCARSAAGAAEPQVQIWARWIGETDRGMDTRRCEKDAATRETYCSVSSYTAREEETNVTRELLTVTYDIDGDGDYEIVPMFDPSLENRFWRGDEDGFRRATLRFTEPTW
jgi:hypothetical protein